VGQQGTHIQASTHIRAHTRMRTHTKTYTHAHTYKHTNTNVRKYSQACTRTNTQTHAGVHILTSKHIATHTRTRARSHTCTHAYAFTCCARDGLRQIFSVASDAPTLVFAHTGDDFYVRVQNWERPRLHTQTHTNIHMQKGGMGVEMRGLVRISPCVPK
jgi:hypothetical protein